MSEITLSLNSLPDGPENMASTLAPMLYDATVNAPPPGVEAQAATGGALLLLAMATLEPLGAAPLGCRSAAAILQFLSRLTVTVILAYVGFGCEAAKAVPAASIQNGYKNYLPTAHLSRTVGLPGGMGFAPGPRGATDPPQISQHKLFEFTRFNFSLKIK